MLNLFLIGTKQVSNDFQKRKNCNKKSPETIKSFQGILGGLETISQLKLYEVLVHCP